MYTEVHIKYIINSKIKSFFSGFAIEGPSQCKIECSDNRDGSAEIVYWPTVTKELSSPWNNSNMIIQLFSLEKVFQVISSRLHARTIM